MADLYPDYDGVVYKFATDTWANIRNATSGTLNTSSTTYVENSHTSGRGGNTYQIGRYFIEFDTSGITSTLDSATLKIYGVSHGTLDVILLKSSQSGAIIAGDFNEINGEVTGEYIIHLLLPTSHARFSKNSELDASEDAK